MSLDHHEVEKIAHLARIAVSEKDKAALAKDLSGILGFVEQMNAVDTGNIVPMAHPLHMAQRLRNDEVTENDQRELFQSVAPETENGLYLVPKVIE
jgi:aspartyl-tRNA(Asn)/glutamyl-tRNA(Gln) amidotransferase subunit C